MTATSTGRAPRPAPAPPPAAGRPRPTRGLRAGQVVAAQVAVALPVLAGAHGALPTVGALGVSAVLVGAAWVRLRGRWLHEWLRVGGGYLLRRRAPGGAGARTTLLDLVAPGARVRPTELAGVPAAVLDDPTGLAVLLELGDPGELLGEGPRRLPPLPTLLPTPGTPGPPLRIQLVVGGAPAAGPGSGAAGTSYRQLTDGRLPARRWGVLAVRVLRTDDWSEEELHRALSGALRRILRRLGPVTARPLGGRAALRVLAECAHHDGEQPVRESWPALRTGPLLQATFQLRHWPGPSAQGVDGAAARLLTLPAAAATLALTVGPRTGSAHPATRVTVRLAGWTSGELSEAGQALHRLVTSGGGELRRLDGEHLGGLAASLPLALPGPGPDGGPWPGSGSGATGAAAQGPVGAELELTLDDAGLMVGANRHGGALTIRLFRPEPTRILLVGGVRAAQMLALRAMALGARVAVQTGRPRVWQPFVRGVRSPAGVVVLLPPGRYPGGAPATPLRPVLLVVDTPAVPGGDGPDPAWYTRLVVRDGLTPADTDLLGRADLAVLQPLDGREAALAGAALGLGGSAQWLTRIREDMVAVVNRRALRWALLSPTPIESQLIGRPARR